MRYHNTPIRMAKISATGNTNSGKNVEQQERSFKAGGNAEWYNHSRRQAVSFYQSHTNQKLCFLVFSQISWKLMSTQKSAHSYLQQLSIYNCQNLEATKMSFGRWMDKRWPIWMMEYCSGIKKKWATTPWKDMEETKCMSLSEKSNLKSLHSVWF